MANISFHGSHNGGLVIEENGEILCVIEVERFLNYKNVGLSQYKVPRYIMITLQEILKWVEKEYGITEFENCYFSSTDFIGETFDGTHTAFQTTELIKAKNYIHGLHHESHAYGVFYQSPYKEAIVFSFDGGGDDGEFNVYRAERGKDIERLAQLKNPTLGENGPWYNLGFAYMIFGQYLKDIQLDNIGDGNLVWPGKIMGLVSYGQWQEKWLDAFIEFFKSDPDGGGDDYVPKLNKLGEKIGVTFDIQNRLEGQIAYDIAATAQRAFEECFIEIAEPYFKQYPDSPICITGGCALNIILNNRIKQEFNKEVFVGPNPSDCGIAVGLMLKHLKPEYPIDITYKGLPILDKNTLAQTLAEYPNVKKLMTKNDNYHPFEQYDPSIIVKDLINGKIIGTVHDQAEHGPRALGNRSIICNPSIPEMKDILNAKVKHREWYRPFAPVVRLEDISKYFEFEGEARWMSFCPIVREEWRDKLAAITHVDNTARVQTVTREQNKWLYDLITEFEKETGVGVLLNTSFNVNGKPILSTYKDAFIIYNQTELDCLLLEDYYIRKEQFPVFDNSPKIKLETTHKIQNTDNKIQNIDSKIQNLIHHIFTNSNIPEGEKTSLLDTLKDVVDFMETSYNNNMKK
jgi:carbamoyltransferase